MARFDFWALKVNTAEPVLPELSKCLKVLENLLPGSYGVNYLIAGGYARDVYYHTEPKDMDVVIRYSDVTLAYVMERCEETGTSIQSFGAHYGQGQIDDRAEAVIKLADYAIDIIFTHDFPHDAVRRFDYNINQVFLIFGKIYFFLVCQIIHPKMRFYSIII